MEKWTQEQYSDLLKKKKQEAHDKMWLYIDVNAKDLLDENEPKAKNLTAVCKAMLDEMLEGDQFIVEPRVKSRVAGKLTVRYYTDNLSPERKKWSEVDLEAAE